jgi:hypothetical protein
MKSLTSILAGVVIATFPLSAQGFSLIGIQDQSPEDQCDELGIICISIDTGNTRIFVTGKGTVTDKSAVINIQGSVNNFSEEISSVTIPSSLPYGTNAQPLPAKGVIWASLNGKLGSFDSAFPITTGSEQVTVTTNATTFSPNTVVANDTLPAGIDIEGKFVTLKDFASSNGELLSNTGLLTVTSVVTLGPRQSFGFENTFVGGFQVPEPTSTLGLFSLGILGAGATIKRQVKRNHSIEKETTKIV